MFQIFKQEVDLVYFLVYSISYSNELIKEEVMNSNKNLLVKCNCVIEWFFVIALMLCLCNILTWLVILPAAILTASSNWLIDDIEFNKEQRFKE